METLTLATWNVHRGRGRDGRVDADRVLAAIKADLVPLSPHVLALQEADDEGPHQVGVLDAEGVERATGLVRLGGHEWGARSHGFQGCVLFLSPGLRVEHAQAIDLPGVWPRGAIAVELAEPRVRIVATHLSLAQPLRIAQMRTIAQFHARRPRMPLVVMGDLNEWRPWGGLALSPRVAGAALTGKARRTFPATRPVLPLDRILCDRPGALDGTRAVATASVRAASDHLPLTARLTLRPGATSG